MNSAKEDKFAENCIQLRKSESGLVERCEDDMKNCGLFWNCASYDEYRIRCAVEDIEPLWTRREFDSMMHFPDFCGEIDLMVV